MATAKKQGAAKVEPEKSAGAGGELYEGLVEAVRKAKVTGELVPHKDDIYTRLRHDGRTVAYIVRGKTVATVYPCALAESAPPDLTFRTVELGSHHYGRGEIIVSVASPDDFQNAVAMLKAAAKMPAVPKPTKAAAPEAVEAA